PTWSPLPNAVCGAPAAGAILGRADRHSGRRRHTIAVQMRPTVTPSSTGLTERELIAHLYRRAGFGATAEELDAALAQGYEATVDDLLHPERQPEVDVDPLARVFPEVDDARNVLLGVQARWLFTMINTKRPLQEKMTLFRHMLFATAESKIEHSWVIG